MLRTGAIGATLALLLLPATARSAAPLPGARPASLPTRPQAAPGDRYRGRPLPDILEELRRRGLNVIYSSALVASDLRATVEPASDDPRDVLEAVLPPFGLAARRGPGGSVLIVRASSVAADRPGRAGEPGERRPAFVEEVVVTPGTISVIEAEQAGRTRLGREDMVLVPVFGGDVSRVIEALPGVAAGDNSAAFNVRGSQARDVSLVLDGLELYEPFHLEAFQAPFSFVDADLVESIDFLKGGFTAETGDRHGGFVRITTRVPEQEATTRLELGTLNSSVSHGARIGRGTLLVSARAWYPEALGSSIELGEDGLDPRFQDAYIKYTVPLSSRFLLSAHTLLGRDRLDFDEPDGAEQVTSDNDSGYLWLRGRTLWSEELFSDTVLSAGRLQRIRSGISDPEDVPLTVVDDRDLDFVGLSHDMSWQASPRQLVKGGFEVRRLGAEYRYDLGPPGAATATRLDPSGTSTALHAAWRFAPIERVALELGLRWDRQRHTRDDQTSPRFNALWRMGERSRLRLGFGRYFQSQRIHELHIEDGETSFHRAELSRQAEITFEHRLGNGLGLRLDAYDRRLTRVQPRYENIFNPLELFPETEEDRVRIAPERSLFRGVEAMLRSRPGRPLSWWVSYTWSRAEDVIDGRDIPRRWDQTHAGNFLLAYAWPRGWSASLTGSVHTGWPTTPVYAEPVTQPDGSIEYEPALGPRNSTRFDTYARLDMKASKTVPLKRGTLTFTLQVTNLSDRRNECCVDDALIVPRPAGGADVLLEVDYWLGITPAFWVNWEF